MSLLRAAQRVLQCVARVHSAGWVHCDLKPAHLMRFEGGEGGETWKLVDFGSATRVDAPVAPSHSRRYCSPEQALAFESHGRSVLMRASPGWDVWAAGLIMFEVFVGAPLFGEEVSYAQIAAVGKELEASATVPLSLWDPASPPMRDAEARLVHAMLRERPMAAALLNKHLFKPADDTVQRRQLQVAAFFSNPKVRIGLSHSVSPTQSHPLSLTHSTKSLPIFVTAQSSPYASHLVHASSLLFIHPQAYGSQLATLNLMREIQSLMSAFDAQGGHLKRYEVRPAARLSDVRELLDSKFLPRVISFSGHAVSASAEEKQLQGFSNIDPFSPYVTPHSPHISEFDSFFKDSCSSRSR